MTRIKICGLCRPEDARLAAGLGADFLGIILAPGTPRSRTPESAETIWTAAPGASRVGVFVDQPESDMIALARRLDLSVLQLHGEEPPETVRRLREAGGWRIWKAVKPQSGEEFEASAVRYHGQVDGLLVDGFSKRSSGGTGTRFPWLAVARRRNSVPSGTAFIVAGGLSPSNVADAIVTLAPDTVDVSSGVESEHCMKSAALMESFIAAVRGAGRRAGQR